MRGTLAILLCAACLPFCGAILSVTAAQNSMPVQQQQQQRQLPGELASNECLGSAQGTGDYRMGLGDASSAGASRHGLPPNQMTLVTSDCGATRSLSIKWP